MYLWLICGALTLLGNAVCDCGLKNPKDAKVIYLEPKDQNEHLFDVEEVHSVGIDSESNEYIDVNLPTGANQFRLTLRNMQKFHWNQPSNSSVKQLVYHLQLFCEDGSDIFYQNMVINFAISNIYAPEMVAMETWREPERVSRKRYTLPMPFPPHVDITIINKITVRDIDMYNQGIRIEQSSGFDFQVKVVDGLRGKYFEISMISNYWLTLPRYDNTLVIYDVPSDPSIKPEYILVDIIIKKDLKF